MVKTDKIRKKRHCIITIFVIWLMLNCAHNDKMDKQNRPEKTWEKLNSFFILILTASCKRLQTAPKKKSNEHQQGVVLVHRIITRNNHQHPPLFFVFIPHHRHHHHCHTTITTRRIRQQQQNVKLHAPVQY